MELVENKILGPKYLKIPDQFLKKMSSVAVSLNKDVVFDARKYLFKLKNNIRDDFLKTEAGRLLEILWTDSDFSQRI